MTSSNCHDTEVAASWVIPGRVVEARLWAGLGAIFFVVACLVFAVALGWQSEILPNLQPRSIDGLVVTLCNYTLAVVFLKIARMRGMSVVVDERGLRIDEWYGGRRSIPWEEPVLVDERMTLSVGGRTLGRISVPGKLAYVIHVGAAEYYLVHEELSGPAVRLTDEFARWRHMAKAEAQ